MPDSSRIRVSVVHAEPGRVFMVEFNLPEGSSVTDAIERSGIRDARPDVEIRADRLGVFARKASFDTVLRDGDRVEIHRALKVDPKDARRRRAESGRSANERQ